MPRIIHDTKYTCKNHNIDQWHGIKHLRVNVAKSARCKVSSDKGAPCVPHLHINQRCIIVNMLPSGIRLTRNLVYPKLCMHILTHVDAAYNGSIQQVDTSPIIRSYILR